MFSHSSRKEGLPLPLAEEKKERSALSSPGEESFLVSGGGEGRDGIFSSLLYLSSEGRGKEELSTSSPQEKGKRPFPNLLSARVG